MRRRCNRSAVSDHHRQPPSRDAIERRLARHLAIATAGCPSLRPKPVTMHTLRHTAAMRLLLAGNDVTVIALWLGHEQLSTTNIYLHADMTHKQQAIDRTKPLATKPGRYGPRLAPQVPGGPLIMPTSSNGIPYATTATAPRSA